MLMRIGYADSPDVGCGYGMAIRCAGILEAHITHTDLAAHNLGHFPSLVIEPRPARGSAGDLQEPSRFNPPETCCRVWDGQSYEHGATLFPSRRACRDRRRKRTGRGHYTFHPSRTPIPRSVSTSICLCT